MTDPEPGPIERAAGSPIGLTLGLVADFAAVVALLTVEAVRSWVSANAAVVVGLAAVLLAISVVCVNAAAKARARARLLQVSLDVARSELRSALDSAQQTAQKERLLQKQAKSHEQDREKYAEFVEDGGKDSPLAECLKNAFSTTYIAASDMRTISRCNNRWTPDPVSYNDNDVQVAFDNLREELRKLEGIYHDRYVFVRTEDSGEDIYQYRSAVGLDEVGEILVEFDVSDAAMGAQLSWSRFLQAAHNAQLD